MTHDEQIDVAYWNAKVLIEHCDEGSELADPDTFLALKTLFYVVGELIEERLDCERRNSKEEDTIIPRIKARVREMKEAEDKESSVG